jgi:hypothetical protein
MPPVVVDLFPSKALLLDILAVKLAHKHVVELEPVFRLVKVKFFLFLDEAVIVAAVSGTAMDHHTDQLEVIIVLWVVQHDFATFGSFLQVLLGILAHVKFEREFEVVIYLDSDHIVKVEFESLQSHDQVLWKALDASTLMGINLTVAPFTKVLVVSLQHVSLDESIETFKD